MAMDPDVHLAAIQALLAAKNYRAAYAMACDLSNWMDDGGCDPDWHKYPEATTYFQQLGHD